MGDDEKPQSGGRLGDYIALAFVVGLTTIVLRADHASMSPWDYFEVALIASVGLAIIGGLTWAVLKVWDRLRA